MTAVIDVQNLQTYFHIERGVVKAVDDVSFQIEPGPVSYTHLTLPPTPYV